MTDVATGNDLEMVTSGASMRNRKLGVPPCFAFFFPFFSICISFLSSASYLDIHLEIDSEGLLRTKLYDKRDDFNFSIGKFPFICSNIPTSPAYGVYISQLMRYSRACGSLDRGLLLTRKLLNQGSILVKLTSSLRKFYGRHPDLS